MNTNVIPLSLTNVAPERDGAILVEAVLNAVDRMGVEEFARSLMSDQYQQPERQAA